MRDDTPGVKPVKQDGGAYIEEPGTAGKPVSLVATGARARTSRELS